MRLILAHLLWYFDFEAVDRAWNWESQKTWILWQKKPLLVRIKIRDGIWEMAGETVRGVQ
jgi:hypothetical protein